MRKQFHALLPLFLAWALLPLRSMACDCSYAGAPCKAFADTPTVFAGRVVKISTIRLKAPSGDDFEDRLVSFNVERSYRGWEAGTAEVLAGWNTDCGYRFQEGVRYLVYAYPHSSTGKLATSICTRTRPMSDASEDLEYLTKKDDPAHGAGIEGIIEELDSKNGAAAGGLERIPVVITGPSGRQTIVSQKDGRFRLWGLSPGRYRVARIFPESFWPVEQTVSLKGNACAELGFLATPRRDSRRREDRWHQAFHGRLAKVEVDRTLYERRKDEDCLIAVRITNIVNRPVGVDLRKFWDVIYPNSWGFSQTSAPGAVDEKRIIRQPMSAKDEQKLKLDYSEKRLTTITPHRSITYFRGFTIGRNIRKEIDSVGNQYLIIGLDGALRITDGQTTEEMIFPANDEAAGGARRAALRLPASWQTVPPNSLVVEDRR